MTASGDCVHHRSSVGAKIALFRSLFRGRDAVYPRRFESRKTGKSGYQGRLPKLVFCVLFKDQDSAGRSRKN